jgi:hypothetical protein
MIMSVKISKYLGLECRRLGSSIVVLWLLLGTISTFVASAIHDKALTPAQVHELTEGTARPLPGLEDGHLFNAENLTVTPNGLLFVTGSKGVYEILRSDGGQYMQREIPITVERISPRCSRNGIISYGDDLYLLCVHIHEGTNPNLADLCDVADVELTLWKAIFLFRKVFKKCQIDSYLLRANLNAPRLKFSEGVALQPNMQPGQSIYLKSLRQQDEAATRPAQQGAKFYANGLAADTNGALFITNSNHDPSTRDSVGIVKIEVTGKEPMKAKQSPWLRPKKGAPNGIRISDDTLYYTVNGSLTGRLMQVKLKDSRRAPHTVHKKFLAAFDDFAISDSVFIIADFFANSLRLVSNDGVLLGKLGGFGKPSSVAYAKNGSGLFAARTFLITEKGKHRLSIIQ